MAAALAGAPGAWGGELGRGVEVRDYQGWRESVYLNATETAAQAVIVPSIGGRLAHFSRGEENILFENAVSLGKTLDGNRAQLRALFPGSSLPDSDFPAVPLWYGGYQCELGPLLRNLPESPGFSSGPQTFAPGRDFSVAVAATNAEPFGVIVEKEFTMAPDTGDLGLLQRIKNVSQKEQSYSLRDRTACKNGGYVLVPLNRRSRFKEGWSYWYQYQGAWVCDETPPRLEQAHALDGVLVVKAIGNPATLGVDSDAGWVAYAKGKLLFVKRFPVTPGGNYSDGGNTIMISFEQQTMEFGPVSPEFKLAPGQSAVFPEEWTLMVLKKEVSSPEEARKLAKMIKAQPFKAGPF